MKLKSLLSTKLYLMNLWATLLVVITHVDDFCIGKEGVSGWLGGAFSAANIANFFIMSGFLIGNQINNGGGGEILQKRLKTLLFPYCVCALAFFILSQCLNHFENFSINGTFQALGFTSIGWPLYDIPLWYIKALLLFVLVTPILFHTVRIKSPLPGAGLLILLLFFPFESYVSYYWFPKIGAFFYILGIRLACFPISAEWTNKKMVAGVAAVLWIAASVLLHVYGTVPHSIPWNCLIILEVAALYTLVSAFPFKVPTWLSKSMFFVYIFHVPLLGSVLRHVFAGSFWHTFPTFSYIVITLITFWGCVGISVGLRKCFPKTYSLLLGGR